MYPEMLYHHCLHKSDLLPIITAIPTIRLKSEVVHSKRVELPSLRFSHCLQSVMPKSAVALSENVTRRLEMARCVRAYPQDGDISTRSIR